MDEYGPNRMIRGKRFKYVTRYPYGPDELYDLQQDPEEKHNLMLCPEYLNLGADMKYRLEKWFLQYVNPEIDGAREAIQEGRLAEVSPEKAEIAVNLATIAEYTLPYNNRDNPFTDNDYSYFDMWKDLKSLVNDETIESMGSKAYGIALYRRVSSLILTHYAEFYNVKVSPEEILGVLDEINKYLLNTEATLTDSERNHGYDDLVQTARENTLNAMKQVQTLINQLEREVV